MSSTKAELRRLKEALNTSWQKAMHHHQIDEAPSDTYFFPNGDVFTEIRIIEEGNLRTVFGRSYFINGDVSSTLVLYRLHSFLPTTQQIVDELSLWRITEDGDIELVKRRVRRR